MKKLLLLPLIFGLAFAQTKFIDRAEFPSWSEEAIEIVEEADIMKGFGDGSFRPRQELNRAEAVTLLLRAKKMQDENFNGISRFPDVPGDAWFAKAVTVAENNEWLTGKGDGKFYPGDTLNRAEFAALIYRAFDLEATNDDILPFEDVNENAWFYEPIKALYDRELLRNSLNKYFRPAQEVTRGEAAWTFAQILQKPGINGEYGSNDFSENIQLDTRRVAIKPRDFNPNKQSVNVEKNELLLSANTGEVAATVVRGNELWQKTGSIRISNTLDGQAKLSSLNVRLRFAENDVGPEENFEAQLTGPAGFVRTATVSPGGDSLFAGLDIAVDTGEEVVYFLHYRSIADSSYFPNDGSATVILNDSDGLYHDTSVGEGTLSAIKPAPMGYGERMIGSVEFKLK